MAAVKLPKAISTAFSIRWLEVLGIAKNSGRLEEKPWRDHVRVSVRSAVALLRFLIGSPWPMLLTE